MSIAATNNRNLLDVFFSKIWRVFHFTLFGIGGAMMMLFFSVDFFEALSNNQTLVGPFISLPLAVAGALLMLDGAGEWGRWAYLWVCFYIVASIGALWILPFRALPFWLALWLPLLIVIYESVRRYYRRQDHTTRT